jgi:hypothetical protein
LSGSIKFALCRKAHVYDLSTLRLRRITFRPVNLDEGTEVAFRLFLFSLLSYHLSVSNPYGQKSVYNPINPLIVRTFLHEIGIKLALAKNYIAKETEGYSFGT